MSNNPDERRFSALSAEERHRLAWFPHLIALLGPAETVLAVEPGQVSLCVPGAGFVVEHVEGAGVMCFTDEGLLVGWHRKQSMRTDRWELNRRLGTIASAEAGLTFLASGRLARRDLPASLAEARSRLRGTRPPADVTPPAAPPARPTTPPPAATTTSPKQPGTAGWRQAELHAAAHMRVLGFTDAQATVAGADNGIDILATDAVGQVKHLAKQVGRPDLQRLVGAAAKRRRIFYSRQGYARPAIVYADANNMALFSYDALWNYQPVNNLATAMAAVGVSDPAALRQAVLAEERSAFHAERRLAEAKEHAQEQRRQETEQARADARRQRELASTLLRELRSRHRMVLTAFKAYCRSRPTFGLSRRQLTKLADRIDAVQDQLELFRHHDPVTRIATAPAIDQELAAIAAILKIRYQPLAIPAAQERRRR